MTGAAPAPPDPPDASQPVSRARPVSAAVNRWAFSVGTLGRDMLYTLVNMYLIVFLTEVLDLTDESMWWITGVLLVARLVDAVTDIAMGAIVDNTRTRWGQYKPWMAVGAVASAIVTVALFADPGVRGPGYVAAFAIVYLLWGFAWTANDIPFWSMMPALSLVQAERERIGSLSKVFATIGLFAVVVGIIPITDALGGGVRAWTIFAAGVVIVMLAGQALTLACVREPRLVRRRRSTSVREVWGVLTGNDQLLWTAVAMVLFMTGYSITTSLGVYFFKYAYRDEGMYAPFAAALGVAQLAGFAAFPLLRRRLSRRGLYSLATALCVAGYVLFWFAPMAMIPIGVAGLLAFFGEALVVVLMLVFITDCIEYGHWKLGRRNGSVTFALQPFINKLGGALATAIVSATLIVTGINRAEGPADVSPDGVAGLKAIMMLLPVALVVASYLIHRRRYAIDESFYARIVGDLRDRGELTDSDDPPTESPARHRRVSRASPPVPPDR